MGRYVGPSIMNWIRQKVDFLFLLIIKFKIIQQLLNPILDITRFVSHTVSHPRVIYNKKGRERTIVEITVI